MWSYCCFRKTIPSSYSFYATHQRGYFFIDNVRGRTHPYTFFFFCFDVWFSFFFLYIYRDSSFIRRNLFSTDAEILLSPAGSVFRSFFFFFDFQVPFYSAPNSLFPGHTMGSFPRFTYFTQGEHTPVFIFLLF